LPSFLSPCPVISFKTSFFLPSLTRTLGGSGRKKSPTPHFVLFPFYYLFLFQALWEFPQGPAPLFPFTPHTPLFPLLPFYGSYSTLKTPFVPFWSVIWRISPTFLITDPLLPFTPSRLLYGPLPPFDIEIQNPALTDPPFILFQFLLFSPFFKQLPSVPIFTKVTPPSPQKLHFCVPSLFAPPANRPLDPYPFLQNPLPPPHPGSFTPFPVIMAAFQIPFFPLPPSLFPEFAAFFPKFPFLSNFLRSPPPLLPHSLHPIQTFP